MSRFQKSGYTTRWIPVKDISVVWAQSQRPLNEKEAQKIADNFDAEAFDALDVTLPNGKGVYHCMDGQTRRRSVEILWGENEKVPCRVHEIKDPARAADIFSKMNTGRTKPQILDRFRVGVTAGYETEVAVNKLITGLGYRVAADGLDGTLSAVGACMTVYRRYGPERLRDALLVIQGTWGKARDSVDGGLISGYAVFLDRYESLDRQRLVSRVSKHYTPTRLIGAAKSAREVWRGTIADNVVRILVSTYNHGLRSGRLDEPDA